MTATAPAPEVLVDAPAGTPSGLLDAFWDYDDALLSNDVARLDDAFARGDDTIRGDGTTTVVGWEAISRFRAARTDLPKRRVTAVHVRVLADTVAVVVADVASGTGSLGLQTQVWQRDSDRWRVVVAHVTAPEKPLDSATWRVVGAPLVPATADDGPLAGETVAVKDLFAVRGQVIGGGVPEYADAGEPQADHAPAVDALLAAGAAVTGISRTDQLAYSISGQNSRTGTPRNAVDADRIPGGSSSGSASATARGWTSIGLGTDTAGSIRVPSAYQGLWGLRTTHGLVSTTGVLPLAQSFDTVGWMTRDPDLLVRVTDAVVLAGARAGIVTTARSETRSDPAAVSTARAFVTAPALTALAVPSSAVGTDRAAAALDAAREPLPGDLGAWFAAFRTVQAHEAWQNHGDWITAHPGALGADVAGRFADAARVTDADAEAARAVLDTARAVVRDWIGDRVLVLPTVADRAPGLGADAATVDAHRAATLRLTSLASFAGLPAVAVPIGRSTGAPWGSVCLVGAAGTDRALVRTARALA